jgi:hypothetical protein
MLICTKNDCNLEVDELLPACRFGYCVCFIDVDTGEPPVVDYCYLCDYAGEQVNI